VDRDVAYFTVETAARALRVTPERVRAMLLEGELEGIPPGATAQGDWKVLLPAAPTSEPTAPVDETPETPSAEQEEAPAAEERAESLVEHLPERVPARDDSSENHPQGRLPTTEPAAAETRQTSAEPASKSGWVTTEVAAEALSVSPRTVRDYIANSKLAAKPEGEGVERRWLVSIDSVQAMLQTRRASGHSPRVRRAEARGGADAADIMADLLFRVQELQYKLGRAEARAELTERAESTLREDLERERVERVEAQRRVEQSRATLEEERRRREAAERERDDVRRRSAGVEQPAPQESSRGAREYPVPPTPQPGRVGPQPALEGVQKPSETAQAPAAASEEGTKHRPSTPEPQEPVERRSWWRRIFGA
jgi:hypothetical protein